MGSLLRVQLHLPVRDLAWNLAAGEVWPYLHPGLLQVLKRQNINLSALGSQHNGGGGGGEGRRIICRKRIPVVLTLGVQAGQHGCTKHLATACDLGGGGWGGGGDKHTHAHHTHNENDFPTYILKIKQTKCKDE